MHIKQMAAGRRPDADLRSPREPTGFHPLQTGAVGVHDPHDASEASLIFDHQFVARGRRLRQMHRPAGSDLVECAGQQVGNHRVARSRCHKRTAFRLATSRGSRYPVRSIRRPGPPGATKPATRWSPRRSHCPARQSPVRSCSNPLLPRRAAAIQASTDPGERTIADSPPRLRVQKAKPGLLKLGVDLQGHDVARITQCDVPSGKPAFAVVQLATGFARGAEFCRESGHDRQPAAVVVHRVEFGSITVRRRGTDEIIRPPPF